MIKKILLLSLLAMFATTANAASNLSLVYGEHENFDRFVFQYDKKPSYSVEETSGKTILKLPADATVVEKSTSTYPRQKQFEKKKSGSNLLFTIPATLIKKFESENKIVIDVSSYKSKATATTTVSESAVPANNLEFVWDKDVGLALFQRNKSIWVVFDAYKKLDLAAIKKKNSNISGIAQVQSDKITALILTMRPKDFDIEIKKDGYKWSIGFAESPVKKEAEVLKEEIRSDAQNNNYIFFPTDSVKNVIMTLDPNTGDVLMIAPVYKPYLNYPNAYKYVDLKILPTIQGVALETYADDILASQENGGLVVRGLDRSMNISPNLETLKKNAKPVQN